MDYEQKIEDLKRPFWWMEGKQINELDSEDSKNVDPYIRGITEV